MRSGRNTILFTLLIIATLLIAACSPRVGAEEAPASDDLVVSLPSLVIDYDESGQASIGGMTIEQMSGILGAELPDLNLDSANINLLSQGNIQHIQVINTANGLLILVNGQPVPSLAWDGESLASTAAALELFGDGLGGLEETLPNLLPLIQNLGVGVTVKLPMAAGTESIPLFVEGEDSAAAAAAAAREEFLAVVGEPPQIRLTVSYDDQGVASIAGIDAESWDALGVPLEALNLDPSDLGRFREMGIDRLGIATNAEGVFLSINDKTLPHISWANGEINHILNLAAGAGLLGEIMGSDADPEVMMDVLNNILPLLQASELNISLDF